MPRVESDSRAPALSIDHVDQDTTWRGILTDRRVVRREYTGRLIASGRECTGILIVTRVLFCLIRVRGEMSISKAMLIIYNWWCELARLRVLSFTIMPREVVWGSIIFFLFHRRPSRASDSCSGHCKRYSTSESSRRKKTKIFFQR